VAAHPRAVGVRRGAPAHEAHVHGRRLPRGRRVGPAPRPGRRDHVGLHRRFSGGDRRRLPRDAPARGRGPVRPGVRLQVQRAAEHPRRAADGGRRPRGGEARAEPRSPRRAGPDRARGEPRARGALAGRMVVARVTAAAAHSLQGDLVAAEPAPGPRWDLR
jgi:hypothetical protein